MLSSLELQYKGFCKKMKKLVLHMCLRAVGSSPKIKYLLIFSANTPNLQWLEPGLSVSTGAFYPKPSSLMVSLTMLGWEEKTLHHLVGRNW